ncbi:MAG: hypothetical protein MI802_12025 [Desulfobacterales bacterium]|nr:hypothetical protein [Desulfobacterales bacterium]
MRRPLLLFSLVILLLCGCASSGPKYIDLVYSGYPEAGSSGTMGISRFTDNRTDRARGTIGHRVLNDKSKEVFLVQGLDLAGRLTDQTQSYLEKKGFHITPVPAWTPTLDGLSAVETDKARLLTGRINKFYCNAAKKGALTEMTLTIDLTLYWAQPAEKKLTTIPVALTLDRTDVNFTRKKVEAFFNDALADVFDKAFTSGLN